MPYSFGLCGKSQVIKTYQSNYLIDYFLRSYAFLLGDVGGESEKKREMVIKSIEQYLAGRTILKLTLESQSRVHGGIRSET